MLHCDCDECKRNRELLEMMREFMPLLVAITRSQALASTTVSNKWRELEGETAFRKMLEKRKTDALIVSTMV